MPVKANLYMTGKIDFSLSVTEALFCWQACGSMKHHSSSDLLEEETVRSWWMVGRERSVGNDQDKS